MLITHTYRKFLFLLASCRCRWLWSSFTHMGRSVTCTFLFPLQNFFTNVPKRISFKTHAILCIFDMINGAVSGFANNSYTQLVEFLCHHNSRIWTKKKRKEIKIWLIIIVQWACMYLLFICSREIFTQKAITLSGTRGFSENNTLPITS